jgi:enoyl-CoA hydratase
MTTKAHPLPVLTEIRGQIGLITLNRTKALNALDMVMIEQITAALDTWLHHDEVRAIVIHHDEGKAYCAGGDVRAIWELRKNAPKNQPTNDYFIATYFRAEYRLNQKMRFYPKPIVAIIDGMTFGGGVGISVHCSFCVATENTQWAMPETAIGFIPDIGASFVLSRLPDHVGIMLGLTGTRLAAADCALLGLASHVMASKNKIVLLKDLTHTELHRDAEAMIDKILRTHSHQPDSAPITPRLKAIADAYGQKTLGAIFKQMEKYGDWGKQQLELLQRMSPTSLKLTHRQLREATKLSFNQCLRLEYRLGQACLAEHDFYEGVRAMLVDKDRQPHWQPKNIEDVTGGFIDRHFDTRWDTKNGALELDESVDHA